MSETQPRVRYRRIHWRCFHCGETFTREQEKWARQHFGRNDGALPVCQMRVPGEHHLLTALRRAEEELARHRAEDTDLIRAMYEMSADHAQALRRVEERGYNKGVSEGREYYEAALASAQAENERLREALSEISRATTPPEQHGHYLAHRSAVKIARAAVSNTDGGEG